MKALSLFRQKSIRFRIMASVICAIIVMLAGQLAIFALDKRIISKMGASYQTNAELSELCALLSNMEKALETYIEYKTFESIDSYYHYQSASAEKIGWLPENPSVDKVLQNEYVVKRLILSLYDLSRDAVSSQRANDSSRAQKKYKESLKCYAVLQAKTEELSNLLMQKNAALYAENKEKLIIFSQTGIMLLLLFFLCTINVLYVSVTRITKPLSDISAVALRLANRDFEVPLFNNSAKTEIGTICRAFDRMIISIREYIDTIWENAAKENELREKELEMRSLYADAQLRALQNQINPHFLFNTMNTGAQLAMIEGADKTCFFMEQVADFFRYNIGGKGQSATIDEELSLIDNFVYIMKVRFGERFEFLKQVAGEKHPQHLPRMTLQPLVENCIRHGFSGDKSRVSLRVEPELYLTKITVSDNGEGFSKELREKILSDSPDTSAIPKASDGNGTGLVNVISRLRLYFHRHDVFDILDNADGGTTFLLRIPNVYDIAD